MVQQVSLGLDLNLPVGTSNLIHPGQPPLPFPDELGFEGAVSVPRHLEPDLAGALSEDRLGPRAGPDVVVQVRHRSLIPVVFLRLALKDMLKAGPRTSDSSAPERNPHA